jgi:pimeloyl-ACP methyl ester carboxylesterase
MTDTRGGAAHEEGFLEVEGRRLEYLRIAAAREDAPTLVFLHEGLGSVSLWRGFPARVAEATGCGAFVYSRAGYGRSDPEPGPWDPDFMHRHALDVLPRVLEAASIPDAVLVGHSDGASIALVHAAADPSRVRSLVLLAPHVFVEDLTVASIAALAEECRASPDLPMRFARHHGASTDALLAAWTGVWLSPGFRAWNIEPHLPRIDLPILVIQGEADEYGTARQVESIEHGTAGRVETLLLGGVGHSPHRDAPDEVLAAMVAFIG